MGGSRARAALVRHHLALLAGWAADDGNAQWAGRLDLDQVVLVGHSRGGEGVNQAAIDTVATAPYRLVGQILLAPTDFAYPARGSDRSSRGSLPPIAVLSDQPTTLSGWPDLRSRRRDLRPKSARPWPLEAPRWVATPCVP